MSATTSVSPTHVFARSGLFYVLPEVSLKPLEELFMARVITFLVDKGLLPVARADMLRGWVHSGFIQLVRYYGWYSNKMRGQRNKRAAEEAHAASDLRV